MKKTILITLCCASLMLVTPLTVVAQENTVSNNLPEQSNDVEGLVSKIRVVIDEILQRYGHIPIVSSLSDLILILLGLIGRIIFCIILYILIIPLILLIDFFMAIGIWPYTINILLIAVGMLIDDYCPWPNSLISKLPFESIYTLSEKNGITHPVNDCPCLQEFL